VTISDAGGFGLASESAALHRSSGVITLVEESSFCLSDPYGNMEPTRPEGLFVGDVRILSAWRLAVDGTQPELLESSEIDPFSAVFVLRQVLEASSGHLLIVRNRRLLHGALREQVAVRNLSARPYHGSLA